MWQELMAALSATFLLWILYRGIKGNKEAFSKENLSQSFMTMGFLALILIGVVAFAVIMLKR